MVSLVMAGWLGWDCIVGCLQCSRASTFIEVYYDLKLDSYSSHVRDVYHVIERCGNHELLSMLYKISISTFI